MLNNIRLEDRPARRARPGNDRDSPKLDRVIEISVLKLLPGGGHDHRTSGVNPGALIPPEATAIHGISDDDVADSPTIRAIAPSLVRFLYGRDLGVQHPELRPAAPGSRVQAGRDRVPRGWSPSH